MARTRTQAVIESVTAVKNGLILKPTVIVKGDTFVFSSKVRFVDTK